MTRSILTRVLHGLLMVAVVHQLVISLVMTKPRPGLRPGDLAFDMHEVVGIAGLGILLAFWVWTLMRRGETRLGTLFPWLSSERRRALRDDVHGHLRGLAALEVPSPASETPLASAFHGVGILVATAATASGFAVYLFMTPEGRIPASVRPIAELHELAGNLMWAYVVVHAGFAVLHQSVGHDILGRMFFASHGPRRHNG